MLASDGANGLSFASGAQPSFKIDRFDARNALDTALPADAKPSGSGHTSRLDAFLSFERYRSLVEAARCCARCVFRISVSGYTFATLLTRGWVLQAAART